MIFIIDKNQFYRSVVAALGRAGGLELGLEPLPYRKPSFVPQTFSSLVFFTRYLYLFVVARIGECLSCALSTLIIFGVFVFNSCFCTFELVIM